MAITEQNNLRPQPLTPAGTSFSCSFSCSQTSKSWQTRAFTHKTRVKSYNHSQANLQHGQRQCNGTRVELNETVYHPGLRRQDSKLVSHFTLYFLKEHRTISVMAHRFH